MSATLSLRDIISLPPDQVGEATDRWLDSIGRGDTPEPLRKSTVEAVMAYPWTFDVFHPSLKPMRKEAIQFAADVLDGRPPRWLSFLGPSGIGKTLLLRQVFKLLKKRWESVQIGDSAYRTPQMAHIIPATDLNDFRSPRDYAGYDLVYVEDIGSGAGLEKGSGQVLRSRITELLQLRSGKWTLLDANLNRGQIADQLDARIASRLKRDGSVCVEIGPEVPDYNG